MSRIRRKLTYANVTASLALFIAMAGGTAFAASELGKESVGTKQLAKGAVTPAKLSKGAKKALTGPQGSAGSPGAPGPVGPGGPQGGGGTQGEPGPGPISLEDTATSTDHTLGVFEGIRVHDSCSGGLGHIGFEVSPSGRLDGFGTLTTGGSQVPQQPEGLESFSSGAATVQYELTMRNSDETSEFTHFSVYIKGSTCALIGMVIPPS